MKYTSTFNAICLLFFCGVANAATCSNVADALSTSPFELSITDSTLKSCQGVSANTADAFFNAMQTSTLNAIFSGTDTTKNGIEINAGFNSLLLKISFKEGSTALKFEIPELGKDKTFEKDASGVTYRSRDESVNALKEYLKKEDQALISQIMNYQAKNSPFSPLTGQIGLIPITLSQDFASSFTDVATNIAGPAAAAKSAIVEGVVPGLLGVSAGYTSVKINDIQASMTTLPLSYTFRNDIDPRRQLVLQMPIGSGDVDGAKLFHAGLGAAYRFPMNDNWTLTPGIKFSMTGSADLATVAGLWSGSLARTYIMQMDGYDLAIGNMVGLFKTQKLSAGDYSFDPGITTTGLRNGIMYSKPEMVSDRKMSLEYSLIDARYFGDKPFASDSQEIGVTLGTNKSAFSARSFIRGGLSYATSKVAKTWSINIGYWF